MTPIPPALLKAINDAGFMTADQVETYLDFDNPLTARQLRNRHLDKGLLIILYPTDIVKSSNRAIRNGWTKKGKTK